MKTSLNLDPTLFKAAKKRAEEEGKTISELVSYWAILGRKVDEEKKKGSRGVFKPISAGGEALIDISSRKDWIDELEKDDP